MNDKPNCDGETNEQNRVVNGTGECHVLVVLLEGEVAGLVEVVWQDALFDGVAGC